MYTIMCNVLRARRANSNFEYPALYLQKGRSIHYKNRILYYVTEMTKTGAPAKDNIFIRLCGDILLFKYSKESSSRVFMADLLYSTCTLCRSVSYRLQHSPEIHQLA
jgi:hypothetical protein